MVGLGTGGLTVTAVPGASALAGSAVVPVATEATPVVLGDGAAVCVASIPKLQSAANFFRAAA